MSISDSLSMCLLTVHTLYTSSHNTSTVYRFLVYFCVE